jgi:DAPG hydrolase PhiG domain
MKKVDLTIPEILPVPWLKKGIETAASGSKILPDGRVQFWIRHSPVKGVSPKMLVWWFSHLEGKIKYEGGEYEKYRVWHPEDHVHASYEKRLPDGSIGPGASIRLVEYLGRNKKFIVNIVTDIEKLDETGYIHNPKLEGKYPVARMEYTFAASENDTIYENCLIIGWEGWTWKLIRPLFLKFVFSKERGLAWIRHNIEEVGQFERFLPELYRKENSQRSERAAV